MPHLRQSRRLAPEGEAMSEEVTPMTPEDLQRWMANVNTQMLELILTVGAGKPQWYKDAMVAEIQRRKALLPKEPKEEV